MTFNEYNQETNSDFGLANRNLRLTLILLNIILIKIKKIKLKIKITQKKNKINITGILTVFQKDFGFVSYFCFIISNCCYF